MGIIDIKNFSFSYGESDDKVINNVNLTVEEGDFLVLCGKSGCGKSTLLKSIKKSIAPFGKREGEILANGINSNELSTKEESELIGFVMQNPDNQIVTDKVWHELAFGLESIGTPNNVMRLKVAEMATYFGISGWFHKKVSELSGGEKQLLNLAGVMVMNPKVLILDEPTSQLDPIAASDFIETIKKINRDFGTTIIITEHRLEEVLQSAKHTAFMENGEITFAGDRTDLARMLYDTKNEMFVSTPAPAKTALMLGERKNIPFTTEEGIRFIKKFVREKNIDILKISEKVLNNTCGDTEENQKAKNGEIRKNEKIGMGLHKNSDYVISVRDLYYAYEKKSPYVINGLSLNIKRGEIFCLLGGNGSGKSTLLALLAGIIHPASGEIDINGKNIRKISTHELYNGMIGAMPQNPQNLFACKTVREELAEMEKDEKIKKSVNKKNSVKLKDNIKIENDLNLKKVVQLTMLEDVMDRHPYDISGGEQQRLALAKILLLKPKILLLDEPTKGMDGYYKSKFGSILGELKKSKITIFIVSHDIEFCAEYADRCGLLFDGKITSCGNTREFFSGNTFYTTAANKLMRSMAEGFVTTEEIAECLGNQE